ncbi:PEP/pyruvate-binding domain-containing protein [Brachybacterium sp. YJGR34]|uniref:PEP/pyruvate-binding domain-containing protein n=1 Tax=Brachybacterium sp. YJGR34 TaxID=2059911 RepID=UPI000E0A76E6|nr:PEP/pyruvate-binding domain-containing protein [Brachybacterium sp. YJGR34]
MRIRSLSAARAEDGGKAATLGRLLRAGFPVPDGVVVPAARFRRHLAGRGLDPARQTPEVLRREILRGPLAAELLVELDAVLGPGEHAVRSSATTEDGAGASAAGQHESILPVHGTEAVGAAILRCWASLYSDRAVAYRAGGPSEMAVLIQHHLDAEVSGVLFTGEERILEAAPGPGERLVGGQVNPESWRIDARGIRASRAAGTPCLSRERVREIDALGRRVESLLGAPVDVEWVLAGGAVHLVQARPITAAVPAPVLPRGSEPGVLRGTPGSGGTATGRVRRLRGPQDFRAVQAGDVLVCRATDPAWTPLFALAGAVVTCTGGALSHAAIVAREVGIPAVLAVPGAWEELRDGEIVAVDGSAGEVRAGLSPRGSRRVTRT